jgi:hypothetical protein
VLPHGFVRIRFFGFLANRSRQSLLPLCRQLLAIAPTPVANPVSDAAVSALWRCPHCGGPMLLVEKLSALRTCLAAMKTRNQLDSS